VVKPDYQEAFSVNVDLPLFKIDALLLAISHLTVLNTAESQLADTDGPMAAQNPKTFGESEVGLSN
jgi:hypothetical protein